MSFPRPPERKSRRSHKNSRDGCPQCKKKRIKCTEELPQCVNCERKNYRCGYLDFPPEKLALIRKKNEQKHRQAAPGSLGVAGPGFAAVALPMPPAQPRRLPDEVMLPGIAMALDGSVLLLLPDLVLDLGCHDLALREPAYKDEMRTNLYKDLFARLLPHQLLSVRPRPPQDPFSRPAFPDDPLLEFELGNNTSPLSLLTTSSAPSLCLPGAVVAPTTFRRIVPGSPQRALVPVDNQRFFVNHEFFLPIWPSAYCRKYWHMVYDMAVRLPLYWCFFMDRLLNVLVTACDYMVSTYGGHRPLAPVSRFTKHDLRILLQKLYVYYDLLIRQLRELIDLLHIEYPTKISLYAGWLTFLHAHPLFETLCTMYNGTVLLANHIVDSPLAQAKLTPTVRMVIQLLYLRISELLIPDYPDAVLHELQRDLRAYLQFVQAIGAAGRPLDRYHQRKLHELAVFVDYVLTDVGPKMRYLDAHYRRKTGHSANPGSIDFVLLEFLFELMVRWFRTLANEALCVGPRVSPVHKVHYLFLLAFAQTLANVFPALLGILLVDLLNLLAADPEFNAEVFRLDPAGMTPAQHLFLLATSKKLIRIITFFKCRREVYIYRALTVSDCFRGVVAVAEVDHDYAQFPKTDIIELMSPRLEGGEQPVVLFNGKPIEEHHYPFLSNAAALGLGPKFNAVYGDRLALERQRYVLVPRPLPPALDYASGMYNTDFNAKPLASIYADYQLQALNSLFTVDLVRSQAHQLDLVRREILKATYGPEYPL